MRTRNVCVALAALVIVGCSSKGAGPTANTSTTQSPDAAADSGVDRGPRAAFVAAANKACREYAKADEALADPEDLKDYLPFMQRFIKLGEDLQVKLRALSVPPDDAKEIDVYLDGNDEQGATLKAALPKIERAVRAKDEDAAYNAWSDAIDGFNAISDDQDPFAKGYGLVDCANDDEGASVNA